jgi:uncharacterized protein (TIGR00645 family)
MEHTENKPKGDGGFLQRWLLRGNIILIPLYFILILAQVPYGYRAVLELWHLIQGFRSLEEAELIISVLTLCDIVMIANLIQMIAIGSYHVFVQKIVLADEDETPTWLTHISSGLLKIKMATSLIGISSIHLLKDFINSEHTNWEQIVKHSVIHTVFLISAAALAYVEVLTHAEKH